MREAPLGMTPEDYDQFKAGLYAALEEDGVSPDQVDIRLQGSAAYFFSGRHKHLWTEEDVANLPDEVATKERIDKSRALKGLMDWFGGSSDRPLRRPFDSHHKLGLDRDPSDYDVQISSDVMVQKCQKKWIFGDISGPFESQQFGFVNKRAFRKAFPALKRWARREGRRLGRPVAPALFRSSGPPDNSPQISSHFKSTDWVIERNN